MNLPSVKLAKRFARSSVIERDYALRVPESTSSASFTANCFWDGVGRGLFRLTVWLESRGGSVKAKERRQGYSGDSSRVRLGFVVV